MFAAENPLDFQHGAVVVPPLQRAFVIFAFLVSSSGAIVFIFVIPSFTSAELRPSSDAELFMSRTQCKLGKSFV